MWYLSYAQLHTLKLSPSLETLHTTEDHIMKTEEALKQAVQAMQALPAWPNVLSTGTRPQPVSGQPLTNGSVSPAAAEAPAQPKPGVACTSSAISGSHVQMHRVTLLTPEGSSTMSCEGPDGIGQSP